MESTYAYLAGAVDAGGFITIGRRVGPRARGDGSRPSYYIVKIGLSDASPVIPDLLQETFPAWRSCRVPKNPAYKPLFIWHAACQKAREPLARLLPHLRVLRRQCEIALELLDMIESQNTGRFRANPISAEQAAARDALYAELTQLNAPGNRRVHLEAPATPGS